LIFRDDNERDFECADEDEDEKDEEEEDEEEDEEDDEGIADLVGDDTSELAILSSSPSPSSLKRFSPCSSSSSNPK
jgi:hypothetical protein